MLKKILLMSVLGGKTIRPGATRGASATRTLSALPDRPSRCGRSTRGIRRAGCLRTERTCRCRLRLVETDR